MTASTLLAPWEALAQQTLPTRPAIPESRPPKSQGTWDFWWQVDEWWWTFLFGPLHLQRSFFMSPYESHEWLAPWNAIPTALSQQRISAVPNNGSLWYSIPDPHELHESRSSGCSRPDREDRAYHRCQFGFGLCPNRSTSDVRVFRSSLRGKLDDDDDDDDDYDDYDDFRSLFDLQELGTWFQVAIKMNPSKGTPCHVLGYLFSVTPAKCDTRTTSTRPRQPRSSWRVAPRRNARRPWRN